MDSTHRACFAAVVVRSCEVEGCPSPQKCIIQTLLLLWKELLKSRQGGTGGGVSSAVEDGKTQPEGTRGCNLYPWVNAHITHHPRRRATDWCVRQEKSQQEVAVDEKTTKEWKVAVLIGSKIRARVEGRSYSYAIQKQLNYSLSFCSKAVVAKFQ